MKEFSKTELQDRLDYVDGIIKEINAVLGILLGWKEAVKAHIKELDDEENKEN